MLKKSALFLMGGCVGFPAPVLPNIGAGNFPRLTDVLNFVCVVLLASAILQLKMLHRAIVLIVIVWILTFTWMAAEAYYFTDDSELNVQRVLYRWALCGCSVYWLIVVMERRDTRYYVVAGMLAGVALSLIVVLYDYITFEPESMPIEELVRLAIYNGNDIHDFIYRAYGFFGHPNGAAGCLLIAVPLLLGLIEERKIPRCGVLAAIALTAIVFYLTKSRGSTIISGGLILFWAVFCTPPKHRMLILLCLGGGMVVALSFLGDLSLADNIIGERFFDFDGINVNAEERWWTISTSIDLMLHHPFGMGSSYGGPLSIATGTNATHNAYLELGLMAGLPLTLFVTVRLGSTAALMFTSVRPIEAWMATYLMSIFLFEMYFLQVNVPILTLWMLWRPRAGQMHFALGDRQISPRRAHREPVPAAPQAAAR